MGNVFGTSPELEPNLSFGPNTKQKPCLGNNIISGGHNGVGLGGVLTQEKSREVSEKMQVNEPEG